MRYFVDTEFIEDGRTIDLLSIGIVAQDGREFYREAAWADLDKVQGLLRCYRYTTSPKTRQGSNLHGTHHHVSAWHLHRYLAEFDYRYNTRKLKDGERTEQAIRQTAGKRLQYRQAIVDGDGS